MKGTSDQRRFEVPGRTRSHQGDGFRRLRDRRWNRYNLWRYVVLLVIIYLLFRFLRSMMTGQ